MLLGLLAIMMQPQSLPGWGAWAGDTAGEGGSAGVGRPEVAAPIFPERPDLAAALAEALASAKAGVAVLFETSDCGECARLRAGTLQDPALREYYQGHFVTVGLHADTWVAMRTFTGQECLKAEFTRTQRIKGLPTLVLYDLEGTPVARQEGGRADAAAWVRIGRYAAEKGYEDSPLAGWYPRD